MHLNPHLGVMAQTVEYYCDANFVRFGYVVASRETDFVDGRIFGEL